MKKFLKRLVLPFAFAAAAVLPAALTVAPAAGVTGDYTTCVSPIPADASWHGCNNHNGSLSGAPVNVRGTHSWSNFHWYANFWDAGGQFLGQTAIVGPIYGTNYNALAQYYAPAGTVRIGYAVHNNCGCGMNDQYWVK